MTGIFLSLGRVLPDDYPLRGELRSYVEAEHGSGGSSTSGSSGRAWRRCTAGRRRSSVNRASPDWSTATSRRTPGTPRRTSLGTSSRRWRRARRCASSPIAGRSAHSRAADLGAPASRSRLSSGAMDDATRRELETVVARGARRGRRCRRPDRRRDRPAVGSRAQATITQKEPGVIFGLEAAEHVFRTLDGRVGLERLAGGGRLARGRAGAADRRGRAGDARRRAHRAEPRSRALSGVATHDRALRRAPSRERARGSSTRARRRRACGCSRRRRCAPAAASTIASGSGTRC